ncbi:hypothetical protein [Algoriphagus boritolerans]|uniref:hypothetical protein n=1 Tax=Algoriphagus boritolerans TaxID=308111 RepID=UPI000AC50A86
MLKDQEELYLALIKINENQGLRQTRNLENLDSGLEFSDKNHPFSSDLDLFGAHSLFQLLNHTSSQNGKKSIGGLDQKPFDPESAQSRSRAVLELSQKNEFLDSMEAIGLAFQKDEKPADTWVKWLAKEEKSGVLNLILAFLGPLGGILGLVLVLLGMLPEAVLGIWIIAGVGLLSRVFVPLKEAAASIPSGPTLKSYRLRSRQIERETFTSPALCLEKGIFETTESNISSQLNQLDRLGLWAQNRMNLLYLPINLLFWTDFFFVYPISQLEAKGWFLTWTVTKKS